MKPKTKPKAPDMPYEAKVWRYALLTAAHDVEQALQQPLKRQPKETLLAYVARARKPVDDALQRWHRANEEMHRAIASARGPQ